jgi:hypothetical protein
MRLTENFSCCMEEYPLSDQKGEPTTTPSWLAVNYGKRCWRKFPLKENIMPVSFAEVSRFVKEAGFIFRGRLSSNQKPADHDSTTQQTIAVEIEEVLLSTDVLRGFRGKIATVLREQAASVEGEGSFIFFTNCLVLSDRLVVREVGQIRTSLEADRAVADAIKEAAERPLQERVAAAELIVEGHVTASAAADPNAVQKSEHDPNWWIAQVSVESVLKGSGKPAKAVEVLFANSKDIAWYKSPKLHQGVRGIFLLHAVKETDRPPRIKRLIYKAIDPLDFQTTDRRPEIEQMLAGEKGNSEKGGR